MSFLRNCRPRHSAHRERGYVLLALLLIVALMIIVAAVAIPKISFQIRRDREEELIHRGVQYSRAIRSYYKKFGRYPTKIEDLENTNNLRFLRKRYKDPMNCPKGKCQDFKLLHFGEVQLSLSGGIGGGGIPGATPMGTLAGTNLPGGLSGTGGTFGQQTAFGGGAGLTNSPGGLGSSSNNAPGAGPSGTPDQAQSTNVDSSSQNVAAQPGQQSAPDAGNASTQVFGGGAIVGVVSASKKESIREFNHKRKYSEWQFIYDPALDRGGLLMTPNQPPQINFGNQNGQNAQQPGTSSGTTFGNQPGGLGNNPATPNPGGTSSPNQPPSSNNPPEQQ
jgi:hypothetical protein